MLIIYNLTFRKSRSHDHSVDNSSSIFYDVNENSIANRRQNDGNLNGFFSRQMLNARARVWLCKRLSTSTNQTLLIFQPMMMFPLLLVIVSCCVYWSKLFCVLPRRLYCDDKHGAPRRSAQLVLHHACHILMTSLAPILPHLIEEVNMYHPCGTGSEQSDVIIRSRIIRVIIRSRANNY